MDHKHQREITEEEREGQYVEDRNGVRLSEEIEAFIKQACDDIAGPLYHLSEASNSLAESLPESLYRGIICYKKINNARYLNKYFEKINGALQQNGIYIGCVETNHQFRMRLKERYPAVIRYPYLFIHFLFRRALPKTRITRKLYFFINRGKNRVLSLTEVLGRLVSCGFEIRSFRHIGGCTWFAVGKKRPPSFDMQPTYGPLVTLNRVGKDGKMIRIYKFRTMHPYAEYLQDYVYQWSNLGEGGKFDRDIRVTGWGLFLRRFWLDEQPMWLNYLKGDLKLVGVRPLSLHYFNLYPEEMQKMRTRYKPGLIPPFYYDLPKTLEEIVESERQYLESYQVKPWRTDISYFFGAIYNIFIKRARSG